MAGPFDEDTGLARSGGSDYPRRSTAVAHRLQLIGGKLGIWLASAHRRERTTGKVNGRDHLTFDVGQTIERTAVAAPPPLPRPKPTAPVSRAANPRVAPVRAAAPPPRADIPAPVADGPRADHDEAEIAAASAAWLRAMPMARPIQMR